jgi:hypothetical protein
VEVARYDRTTFDQGIAVAGNRVYLTGGGAVDILDISSLPAVQRIGTSLTPGYPRDVDVSQGLIYVADEDGGLLILSLAGAGVKHRAYLPLVLRNDSNRTSKMTVGR